MSKYVGQQSDPTKYGHGPVAKTPAQAGKPIMAQTSGSFPALSDNVKKTGGTRKPKK